MEKAREIMHRLNLLRRRMEEEKIDYYLITTADYHSSEYVSDYFKVREYFSGFTGSNGDLLVWADGAGLWTDGRYFVQAEKELKGTGIELFRMQVAGVPTISQYLEVYLQPGQRLGLYGKTFSIATGKKFEALVQKKDAGLVLDKDLAGDLWENRPAFPCNPVYALTEQIAGRGVEEKLALIRKNGIDEGEGLLLTKLDDIMWLFNLRGSDVECNPVAMSYAYITEKKATLFLQPNALDTAVRDYLNTNGIALEEYDSIDPFLKQTNEYTVKMDFRYVSMYFKALSSGKQILDVKNPTELEKALKCEAELKLMREYYLQDSVAVTKFIYWLKKAAPVEELSEVDAANYLDGLRAQIPGFIGLSFPTISAYGANAAMMHYEATKENHSMLSKKDMLLVDSGGQYLGATTDVTRTISLGPVAEEVKKYYTLTAMGMLQLSKAVFLQGCTGRNVDILARMPLWEKGMDYRCGTGHGVGYILNVHEGPHGIRWRYQEGSSEAVLQKGMVVTNEPGVYVDGAYGIRIENVMAVEEGVQNEYGQFLHFETLTFVPLDRDALVPELFDEKMRQNLNAYHACVYEKLAPFLTEDEKAWLKIETSPF